MDDDVLTQTTCPLEMLKPGPLAEFDAATRDITERRGAVYAHPSVDFGRATAIGAAIADCPDPLIRHALYMIGVKMSRLVQTPDHLDSLIDIAGYARTAAMVIDKRKAEKAP